MFVWIRTFFRIHFGFSQAEANGTLALLLLTSVCLLVPQGVKWYYCMQPEVSQDQDMALLERVLEELETIKQNPEQLTAPTQVLPVGTRYNVQKPKLSHQLQPFDINAADAAQLSTVKGIGPVFSTRIVKFRDRLGGFVSQTQYQEVYGLSPEVVDHLKEYTYIGASFYPNKLDINTADAQALAAHPYLTYQQARSIVRYRAQHGPFTAIEALSALVLIDPSTLEKAHPYLCVSP